MHKIFVLFLFHLFLMPVRMEAQTPKSYTSSELLHQLKKLDVLGSVLYIAAHPDDENTRLLAYLANERLFRTGYLSLTRGDGGQNLIGDEQGVELGLIRTQELLAARRIDGAEQFFTRAYDFGFCKSSKEALETWGHEQTLSDVVWVIRKFQPDVIIARFPEDSRAGHGHHAASGILAREAFDAAADPTRFPEQLQQGVSVWQAKRMLWNTFNFGSNNTQNENQLKIDAGAYNPLLGKSYGEIAALSRSQHKSQGFGVPAQRGAVIEYFETIRGEKPVNDIMDGVNTSWSRLEGGMPEIHLALESITKQFDPLHPSAAVPALVSLHKLIGKVSNHYWKAQKQQELVALLEQCSGIYLEAVTGSQYAVQGDSLKVTVSANNRSGVGITNATAGFNGITVNLDTLKTNTTVATTLPIFIQPKEPLTQPYWLKDPMLKGSFNVANQQLIGKAENDPVSVTFSLNLAGETFSFQKPVRYKYTDPVKGEVYQPISIVPQVTLNVSPELNLVRIDKSESTAVINKFRLFVDGNRLNNSAIDGESVAGLKKGAHYAIVKNSKVTAGTGKLVANSSLLNLPREDANGKQYYDIREIEYDHIPAIRYFKEAIQKIMQVDIKTVGKSVGYIAGAGDKVPAALMQMGYTVTMLNELDIAPGKLAKFDAIVTGVRAYNTNDWMNNVYEALMEYVKNGGVLLVQYNTSSQLGPVKAKIAPYPFNISRTRVTDETAKVNFLLPNHSALNYPNKITEKDFDGWIQERSIYHADQIDSNYQRILSMSDPGESAQDGSLIIANYGKGKFVYTGLVFFRELPAGVPGAYRLLANLIAPPEVARMSGSFWGDSPATLEKQVKSKKRALQK